MDGLRTDTVAATSPILWFNNVIEALLRGSRAPGGKSFLRVSGEQSRNITLVGNDLTRLEESVEFAGAPKSAVVETGNAR